MEDHWWRQVLSDIIDGSLPALFWIALIAIFIWKFGSQIERLIDRVRKVGTSGIETADPTNQKTDTPNKDFTEIEGEGAHAARPFIVKWKNIFRQNLADSQTKLDRLGLTSEDALLIYYAELFWDTKFRDAYRSIWGSQIELLMDLKKAKNSRMNLEESRKYYLRAKQQYIEAYKDYKFESWLGFLYNMQLIHHPETAGCAHITDEGSEFLDIIYRNSWPTNKIY